jgi:hypothetical protein
MKSSAESLLCYCALRISYCGLTRVGGWVRVIGLPLLADLHNQMRRVAIAEREAPLCGVMCLRGFDLDVI